MGFPRTYITGIIFFFASISVAAASSDASLEIYEVDFENKAISVRLRPHSPADSGIDEYSVFFTKDIEEYDKKKYKVSKKLECTLWEDSVCFEKHPLSESSKSENDWTSTKYEIQIRGDKAGERQQTWNTTFKPSSYDTVSTMPMDFTYTNHSHGMVTLMWRHPLFPNKKIQQFEIVILQKKSALLSQPVGGRRRILNTTIKEEKKKYMEKLWLSTATEYDIEIFALNPDHSKKLEMTFYVPSDVVFASGAIPEVTNNGTLIDFKIPAMVNVTSETFYNIVMKGIVTCAGEDTLRDWSAREGKVSENKLINEEFDANETESGCYLNHGRTYEIKVEIIEKKSNIRNTFLHGHSISFPAIDSNGQLILEVEGSILNRVVIAAVCVIAIISLALLFLAYKRIRRRVRQKISKQDSDLTSIATDGSPTFTSRENSTPPLESMRLSTQHTPPDVVPWNVNSNPVKIVEFEEYVKEALASGLLDSQYGEFPRGLMKPCDYGLLPENVEKNRYKNLIAYDETRVILDKNGDDPHSDYINANYIQGYKKDRAYIATQGPRRQTVKDFWRMIWENDVYVICMLANVKEGGKIKCEQYWPEVGSRAKYGNVLVTNINHEVFADYTFRNFKLTCNNVCRQVTHLHYTGWPDHGIPTYTQSLVSYLKKLQDTSPRNGPIVVHCSAGVGRTGTIILCDICLKQASAEMMIDVLGVTEMIRNNRANMVDSAQQYLLAHLTIVESMVPIPTQIPCNKILEERIKELRKHLPSDIQRLNDTVWQDRALHALAAPTRPTPEDLANNGISEPVKGSFDAAELIAFNGENNSINAVSVDGVKMKKQYLASCLPSDSTLGVFWELIYERNIELVVILQRPEKGYPGHYKRSVSQTFCDIMPDGSILVPVPHLKVERKTILIKEDHFLKDKLLLSDTTEEGAKPRPVTVVTCKGWGCGEDRKPPITEALISLWRTSEKISRKESPTLVLCHDGVTACGLYLALSFLLERMSVERECDIISAVRAVRRSRPEFVQPLRQFDYLYDAAVEYTKCFETYANFS